MSFSRKPYSRRINACQKVIEYANDSLCANDLYEKWGYNHDGASMICRMLFEDATDINFFVGRAVNSVNQKPNLPINFNIKMNLVEQLSERLKKWANA